MKRVNVSALSVSLAALALCAGLAAPTATAADATTNDGTKTPLLRDVPDLILSRWRSSQLAAGNYQRASGSAVDFGYGNSALAYAMLVEAIRSSDDAYFQSAMRGFDWLAGHRIAYQGVFNRMFIAAGFNLANSKYGARPEFKAIKGRWALMLRHFGWIDKPLGDNYRYNKNVVEAVETLEATR